MTTTQQPVDLTTTPAATPAVGPAAGGPVVTVASYASYAEAEAAVDRLSDAGFPVAGIGIVGRGLESVEIVTGRLAKGRAALAGLGAGLWTGLFVGLLLGLFEPGIAWLGVVATGLGLGAVWGAVIGFVGHLATDGRRDFRSEQTLRATRYEIVVDRARVEEAVRLLSGASAG